MTDKKKKVESKKKRKKWFDILFYSISAVVILVLLFIGLLLAGCSSEFYKHDSLFKDWDHVKFSWWGYKNPTAEAAKMSDDQGWWGEEIPYIPAE